MQRHIALGSTFYEKITVIQLQATEAQLTRLCLLPLFFLIQESEKYFKILKIFLEVINTAGHTVRKSGFYFIFILKIDGQCPKDCFCYNSPSRMGSLGYLC